MAMKRLTKKILKEELATTQHRLATTQYREWLFYELAYLQATTKPDYHDSYPMTGGERAQAMLYGATRASGGIVVIVTSNGGFTAHRLDKWSADLQEMIRSGLEDSAKADAVVRKVDAVARKMLAVRQRLVEAKLATLKEQ